MALIRICVADDVTGAYALAQETATRYRSVPSYAAVQDREGLDDPAQLHLIGSWERILDGLGAYAAPSFDRGRGLGAAMADVTARIYADFEYKFPQEAFSAYLTELRKESFLKGFEDLVPAK